MTIHPAGCILLMDFDGVTHPEPCEADQLFMKLPAIEDVLREFEDCQIVISSSWRVVHPLDEMREYFAVDMRSRVVGVTPEYPRSRGDSSSLAPSYERQWECERWLRNRLVWLPQRQRDSAPWIAIDDRHDWFAPGCANLLHTNAATGFGREDALRLHAMLKQRLP
jgi:hypothetical protein